MYRPARMLAVYGGVFDPPHEGHLQTVRFLAKQRLFDQVIIIPVFSAPHQKKAVASYRDRMRMCEIAFAEMVESGDAQVSEIESRLPKPSYSYRTYEALSVENPQAEILPVIGLDNYLTLSSWKNTEALQAYRFVVLARQTKAEKNAQEKKLPQGFSQQPEKERNDLFLDNPHWDFSSTAIRKYIKEAAQAGKPLSIEELEKFVPEGVADYIVKNKIYL